MGPKNKNNSKDGTLWGFEWFRMFPKMYKKFKFSFFCTKMQLFEFEQKLEKEQAQQFWEVNEGSEKCVKAILWAKINKRLFLKNHFFVKSLKENQSNLW